MAYNKNTKHHTPRYSKGGDFVKESSSAPEELEFTPLQVKVYGNNFDRALKAFRALVQKEKILSIYKEKQSYEKPSQRKRREKNESKRKFLEEDRDKR